MKIAHLGKFAGISPLEEAQIAPKNPPDDLYKITCVTRLFSTNF